MMNKSASLQHPISYLGIQCLLFGVIYLLMAAPSLTGREYMNLAISVDLLLTIPLIYLLLIRKTSVVKTTVVPVMIIGFVLGTYLMPQEHQVYLGMFQTWALPVIELSIISYVIFKIGYAFRRYKKTKQTAPDFFTALISTCAEILPKRAVHPFATEIAVFYYGFFHWKAHKVQAHEFTYHKKSGSAALMYGLIFIIGIETVTFHLLLSIWNDTIAWVLTAISSYTAFQLYGFARALSKRPIAIHANHVTLRYGILNEVDIPFSAIDSIELSRKALPKDKLTQKLSALGDLEGHNVVVKLNRTLTLQGIYGIKKPFNTLGLHIDDPQTWKVKLEEACSGLNL